MALFLEEQMNRLKELAKFGQTPWLDYIRRDMLEDGTLQRLVGDDGVGGLTSNPAIFQQAIADSDLYDVAIHEILQQNRASTIVELYEKLAVQDIQMAADILMPTFESTQGVDGYVSLEVSPHLARDAEGSVAEARHLADLVSRPNLLIKIPATEECIPAIEQLLAEGINVNVTLMFSMAHYDSVAQAYLRAMGRNSDPKRMASVASFFVSRVDTAVDEELDRLGTEKALGLRGRIAIANSKVTYQRYLELFYGKGFEHWRTMGARPQRVLWASTSTKDPTYRDVTYVEELIGDETVNTIPPSTLEAFRDHGSCRPSLTEDIESARMKLRELGELGIDLNEITEELQRVGVEKFAKPFDSLMETLSLKRAEILEEMMTRAALEG
jgi:transaldolase